MPMNSAYDDGTLLPPDCSIRKSTDNSAYLRLPVAYRSLSRPSSAPSAKAFTLRPFSLDHNRRQNSDDGVRIFVAAFGRSPYPSSVLSLPTSVL